MDKMQIPRIVFAAPQSSSGKTTVVAGFLAALRQRGLAVQPYKIGPDYIDPAYHALAAGRRGHNLDTWLVEPEKILALFTATAQTADIAVIEGVMGLYDGGRNGISSTAELAKRLQAPVILVINCRSMGESAAALALGFRTYDSEVNFAGVILNCLGSASHKQMICAAMEKLQIPVLGAVMRDAALKMPERHLGLTPAIERDAAAQIEFLAQQIAPQLCLDEILAIGKAAPPLPAVSSADLPHLGEFTIAVANDQAFSFYYQAGLDILREFGAKIVFFSPLQDVCLPACDAVIFGGGFPEMFAKELAANKTMLESIRHGAAQGLPIYGECGGFMYLTQSIIDFAGEKHQMVGLVPAQTKMEQKLQMVGYVTARCLQDCLLGKQGDLLQGHEFHFSVQLNQPADFAWAYEFTKNRTGAKYLAGYAKDNILASYLHLHFLGTPQAAQHLCEAAVAYRKGNQG